METMHREVDLAAALIRQRCPTPPRIALVLGTGLGGVAQTLASEGAVPYGEIPGFPVSTVASHEGRLLWGHFGGKYIFALQGRFHLYEGYSARQISFPYRVLAALGVRVLITTNAVGGLNPLFSPGDLMCVTDHINLTGANPLIGPNLDAWGPRFPEMTQPYSRRLRALAEECALETRIPLRHGVYVGVTGPSLETAAETRMLRLLGADAVGMSTVMEVITAVHAGMEVLAISVVTNVNRPDCYEPASLESVIATAEAAGPRLSRLIEAVLSCLWDPAATSEEKKSP